MPTKAAGNILLKILLGAGILFGGLILWQQVGIELEKRNGTYESFVDKGNNAMVKNDILNILQPALENYKNDTGKYPFSLQELEGKYILKIPKNINTETDYIYNSDGKSYTLVGKLTTGSDFKVSK